MLTTFLQHIKNSIKEFQRKLQYESIVIRFLRNFFYYRLTFMGRNLFAMGLLLPLLGGIIFSSTFMLYAVVFFFTFIFVMSFIMGHFIKPKLDLKVVIPTRSSAGSVITEEITLRNKGGKAFCVFVREDHLPRHVVAEQMHGKMIPVLDKNEELKMTLSLNLTKRGDYMLNYLRVESPFPLGVFNSGYSQKIERSLLVYPTFKPLINLSIPAGRKLQPGGIALASNIGESTEFLGTREFRTGDDPRYIHWKSWARLQKPIIKEFQEEYFCRIALFIDTFVPEDSPELDYEAFESLLSLAASISDYLERQEYIIDIIAAGPDIYYLQAGRSLAYLDQILDILACLDVCRHKPYVKVEPTLMDELSQISTVIVLLLGWDDERREFLFHLKEMGVDMRVFFISNKMEELEIGPFEEMFGPMVILNSQEISRGFDEL